MALLGVLLAMDQGIGHHLLESTILHPGRATEELEVATALVLRSTVHHVGEVGVKPDAPLCTVPKIYTADEERLTLQFMEVDKEAIRGHVLDLKATGNAAREIGHGLVWISTLAQGFPATLHSPLPTPRVDLRISLVGSRCM